MGGESSSPIEECVPLDQHVEEALNKLKESAVRLWQKLQLWTPAVFDKKENFPRDVYFHWLRNLTSDHLEEAIASVQGQVTNAILSASSDTSDASARLKNVQHRPYFQILIKQGSEAREDCDDDHIILTDDEIIMHMSARTGQKPDNCYFAWYAIATCLLEDPDLLPDMWVRIDRHHYEAKLHIKYDTD